MYACKYIFITNSILWEKTGIPFLETPDMALSRAAYVPGTFLGTLDMVVGTEQRNVMSSRDSKSGWGV